MMPRTDRLLLVNAMLGQFITGFAGRSFVVALPTIANTLHADILGISWAIIAYTRSLNMDAAEYRLPEAPAILYFHNPFSAALLAKVLESVRRSLERHPRELWACHGFPRAHQPLDEAPFFELTTMTTTYGIYRARSTMKPVGIKS
jgi:hypothetical protein